MPVRVIHGRKCENSYVKKVYTYDGLYKVITYKKFAYNVNQYDVEAIYLVGR